MRSIETEGDTIDEAIADALQTLQVERDRVAVEILTAPTRGMLGFGARKARVRATVRAPLFSSFDDVADVADATVSRETATLPAAEAVPSPASQAQRLRTPRREPEARPVRPDRRPAQSPAAPVAPPSPETERRALEVLRTILRLVGVDCRVDAGPGADAGTTVLSVMGEASALVIGHRGQTLDALEYMVNRIVGRDDDGQSGRLVVDVEGYRERRRQYLWTLAQRLAEKAKQSGRVVTLNPMTPRDRRIVHLALQDDQAVTTRSQGEGHFRKVLIMPADRPRRGARPPREPA